MKQFLPLLAFTVLLSGCTSPAVKNSNQPSSNNDPQPTSETQKSNGLKSLKDLLSGGVAQKCTWTVNEGDGSFTGTILIKDKKFRQDYEMVTPEGKVKSHAISDGVWMYTWTDQNKDAGLKMKIEEATEAGKNIPTVYDDGSGNTDPVETKGKSIDMDKEMNYNCIPATISDADVTPPSDIKFIDMAETLKGLQDKFKDLIPAQ